MLLFLCKDLSLCSSSPGHIRVVRCTSQIHNTVHVGHIHEGDAHKRTQSLDTGGRGRSISASFRTFGPMSVVFPWTWTKHSSTLHARRFHGVGVSNFRLAFHPDGSLRYFFSFGWMIPRSRRGLWGLFVHCAHILWVVSCRQAHGIDPRAFLNEECFLITAQLPSIATQPSFDPSTHRCGPPPSSSCPLNDRVRTSVRSSFSFPFAFGLSF